MMREQPPHLPMSREEMERLGWDGLDVLFVTGDPLVDHPSFGVPLLARLLIQEGFRVGVIPQPDWRDPSSVTRLGRPRLFVGVSAGSLDSMLAVYTPRKKKRHDDPYAPGGKSGLRPPRATVVYCSLVKGAFRDLPVVIGGIEASLRRFAHYDYWDDRVRRSILLDAKADLLVYGMGERALIQIARRLDGGEPLGSLTDVRGTAYVAAAPPEGEPFVRLPSFEEVAASPQRYAEAFRIMTDEANPWSGRGVIQPHGDRFVVANPPQLPLSTDEMDRIYGLPFSRLPHPSYREPIPAWETVRDSVTSHRGCAGGCAFCAITLHQGKTIQSRSVDGIRREIERLASSPLFRGTVSDVGGPTANMYGSGCGSPEAERSCRRTSCLHPRICPRFRVQDDLIVRLLEEAGRVRGVRRVHVSSGLRTDLLERQPRLFRRLVERHVGGLLKVAPESLDERLLAVMRKPSGESFVRFLKGYRDLSRRLGKRQGVVPYLIAGHPGSTLDTMVETRLLLGSLGLSVEQVQEFTPTPGTLSTCIYHTGVDPSTGERHHVPRSDREKILQKEILVCRDGDGIRRVASALRKEGRGDLAERLIDFIRKKGDPSCRLKR